MPLRPEMEAREYLALFSRRKWFIIFVFLFILFAASIYSVVMPEQFKSTTTILIIPQRVPENFVQSTVSIGVEDRLATIRQQVMSRTRLLMVMKELNLFGVDSLETPPEDLLEKMRERIEIEVVSDMARRRDHGTDAFSVSFLYEDRKLAMLTASRLASLFIDENLKAREQQAIGTSEFLESQLKETKSRLEAQEEQIKQYKLRFMGELPQELQTNLTVLTRLQEQYKTNADGIRAAEDRKVFLESQLGMIERSWQTVVREPARVDNGSSRESPAALMAELTLKRSRLADLSSKYTERYPEIIRIRREVELLEGKLDRIRRSQPADRSAAGENSGTVATTVPSREAAEVLRLRTQISGTQAEIAALKREQTDIQKTIADFQSKVERSPRREQEMISLTRDYENLKQSYNDLLKKKLEADISQNLEKRQKGEQFQIIDPANYPMKPSKPDRRLVYGITLLLAVVLGFGGSIGLEMADLSLRDGKQFKHFFDLPVMASIPVLRDEAYQRRVMLRKVSVFGGIIGFTVAASVFLFLYGAKVREILNF